ncbi:MAG: hypothetical protein J6R47_03565 [Acholeplasmatales bacterium]|nr:hypothetical protein [Acholeplasmatales bacterium]
MMTRNELIQHIKDEINNVVEDSPYKDLTFAYHDEFSYNTNVDVDITIKALSGTIRNKRLTYPVQIIAEIKNDGDKFAEAIEHLMNFSINNNEVFFTHNNQKIQQFYTTPSVISTFNEDGLYEITTVAIDATFILYNDAIFTDDIFVQLDNEIFTNILHLNWANSISTNSIVTKESPFAQNYPTGSQIILTIEFEYKKNDPLHEKLCNIDNTFNPINLIYHNGYKETTFKVIKSTITQDIVLGGVMGGQAVFALARRD